VDAEAIAGRVWPGRELAVEPLGGGITNHNFRIQFDGERFVLRIGGKDTDLLGIDRRAEYAAARAAADLQVGPEVVAFVEPEGYLVTRFVEGAPVPPEELRRPEELRETAALLRRVHEGPSFPVRFDAFRVVEAYRATAIAHGVQVPPDYEAAKARADEIERTLGPQPAKPCHNDLLNANFIRSPDGIRVVDWEYAGMGDRFFDLANFSVNHELAPTDSDILLQAYFGELRDEHREHLRLMRFMSDFREAMWGVVQQGISELDFDFEDYTRKHFERLELS
jgi:thiamine kinase-like enzyme